MSTIDHIVSAFERIGAVATGLRKWLNYFLLPALVASVYLAVKAYSVESAFWFNALKCGLLMLPVLVWAIVWFVLGQLREAPTVANQLVQDKDQLLTYLSNTDVKQVTSLRGAYSTLKVLREQEGLEEVMNTIGGVTLLINPIFAILAVCALFILFMFLFAAFVVFLF